MCHLVGGRQSYIENTATTFENCNIHVGTTIIHLPMKQQGYLQYKNEQRYNGF